MDVELKPCPWCGKVPNIGPWGAQDLNAWPDATAIECSSDLHDCPVNPSVTGYTRAEAITAWNTRHGAGDADRSAELTTAWMAGAKSVRERAAEDSARLDWLCSSRQKKVERTLSDGWFRVYQDMASIMDPEHWRAMTDQFYETAREAIDAARAGERG